MRLGEMRLGVWGFRGGETPCSDYESCANARWMDIDDVEEDMRGEVRVMESGTIPPWRFLMFARAGLAGGRIGLLLRESGCAGAGNDRHLGLCCTVCMCGGTTW